MSILLARAARRLAQGSTRGLGDALAEAGGAAGSSSRQLGAAGLQQQPWAATALRASSGGSSGSSGSSGFDSDQPSTAPHSAVELEAALAVAASTRVAAVAGSEATSTAAAATAAAAAEAAAAAGVAATGRARPPSGHTDFQQRQLLMLFTCTKCDTRAAKAFSKQSYEQGVVIVECPGCSNRHLIADHLGWFGQKGTVEEFAAERGSMVVRRMADGTVELTPEELLGSALAAEAHAAAAGAGQGGEGLGSGESDSAPPAAAGAVA